MKLKQLINGGALAATVLTLGSAQAERNPYEGIVFCRATVMSATGLDEDISVTLPFTTTGVDGQEYTFWNIGDVPAGGVADSWHDKGGPGRFEAHNNGKVGAYIYLTSKLGENNHTPEGRTQYVSSYASHWNGRYPGDASHSSQVKKLLVDNYDGAEIWPTSSLRVWRSSFENPYFYCLAFTRDMTAKAPNWQLLDRFLLEDEQGFSRWIVDEDDAGSGYIGAYMGYLDAGEHMPFDVKFWAPRCSDVAIPVIFSFKVEAAAFPLWEHDFSVQ